MTTDRRIVCFPYQFSSNVPMTFVWPDSYPSKTPRGTVSPLVTELRDVFPTMLDAAGATDRFSSINSTAST
jgi:arylsulfatase A-like enzyme